MSAYPLPMMIRLEPRATGGGAIVVDARGPPGVFHWTTLHPRIGETCRPTGSIVPAWRSTRSCRRARARVVFRAYEQPQGRVPLEPPPLPRQRPLRRCVRLLRALQRRRPPRVQPRRGRRRVRARGTLPGGVLACEVGGICPDETALYLPEQRALTLADGVVRGQQGSSPGFVPDGLMDDPPGTKRALLAAYARLLTNST